MDRLDLNYSDTNLEWWKDKFEKSMKETTIDQDYMGNPDGLTYQDGGYQIRKYKLFQREYSI